LHCFGEIAKNSKFVPCIHDYNAIDYGLNASGLIRKWPKCCFGLRQNCSWSSTENPSKEVDMLFIQYFIIFCSQLLHV